MDHKGAKPQCAAVHGGNVTGDGGRSNAVLRYFAGMTPWVVEIGKGNLGIKQAQTHPPYSSGFKLSK